MVRTPPRYSGLVGGLLLVAHAALLACVGGLTFLMRTCLRWFPALVSDCLRMPNHRVSLKCTDVVVCGWRACAHQAGGR